MMRLYKTDEDNLILYLGRRPEFRLLSPLNNGKNENFVWIGGLGREIISTTVTFGVKNEEDFEVINETFKEFMLTHKEETGGFEDRIRWNISLGGHRNLVYHSYLYGLSYNTKLTYWATSHKRLKELIDDLRKKNYLIIWHIWGKDDRNIILG